jgi:hypothetical protein
MRNIAYKELILTCFDLLMWNVYGKVGPVEYGKTAPSK